MSSPKIPDTLDDQFNALLDIYRRSIDLTAGCGERGQFYIDSAHDELVKFGREHPTFANRVPSLYRCHNDGYDGVASGIGHAFSRWWL